MARHIASHRVTFSVCDGGLEASRHVTPPYKGVTCDARPGLAKPLRHQAAKWRDRDIRYQHRYFLCRATVFKGCMAENVCADA
jgi:hypothetical protein